MLNLKIKYILADEIDKTKLIKLLIDKVANKKNIILIFRRKLQPLTR